MRCGDRRVDTGVSPASETFRAAWGRGRLARLRAVFDARSPDELAIMPLTDALSALGHGGETDVGRQDVPAEAIVGTVARAGDFDRDFRPLNRALRHRWETLAHTTADLPPVRLVRLGELYFVADGHHRVSIARARGLATIPAQVRRICTIACVPRCLTVAHLPMKAAERMFLQRVPLDDEIRLGLWLDDPKDWFRLADSAEAWGFRRGLARGRLIDRAQLATAWWEEEVMPVVATARDRDGPASSRDIEVYLSYGLDRVG
jgi:hypothetical protein